MSDDGQPQHEARGAGRGASTRSVPNGDQPPAEDNRGDSACDAGLCGRSADSAATVGEVLVRLVADHHAAVYRYAYRLCGSAGDAEDITQQTFLVAQEKLDQVRQSDRIGHWLLVVARNVFLKMRRRRTPLPAGGLEIDVNSVPDPASLAAEGQGVGHGMGRSIGRSDVDPIDPERLQAAVNELPDEFRLPLLMFYFEEASYREIAEQLDLPPGTVMSRLSRAKCHLRKRLLAAEVRG